jgi:hypothetical protein
MKMEQTVCSETSAYKIQQPGNYPEESIQNSVLIKIQPDATVCRYLFTAKSLYMFRESKHPSSGVLKTVAAASGTGHNTGTDTSVQCGPIGPRWTEVSVRTYVQH